MKNFFFFLMISFFGFLSCRNDENDVQNIDQVINLYIDSSGQDMLNTTIEGGYSNIRMNDVNGLLDVAPVSFSQKKDVDTINYLEYLAGARRILIDSTADFKTYESRISLLMTKKIDDSTNIDINDALKIQYYFSPQKFQVSKVWYNDVLVFTKVDGQPNIVKISK